MNSPTIRFNGYHEEWVTGIVADLANICGGGTPKTGESCFWNGEIQWYTPSEITNKYIQPSRRTITTEGLNKSTAKLLPKNAILFTSRATIGLCSINNTDWPVCTNQGFQSLIPKNLVDVEFLYYLVTNPRFLNQALKKSSGSTFLEISSNHLKKIQIKYPSINEQKKIASFLAKIDEKVFLAEQKLEAFEKLKKELMKKVFKRQIRFKKTDGTNYREWRQENFFDVIESLIDFRGRTPKKLGLAWSTSETEHLALSALNVKNWGIDRSLDAHFGDLNLYNKWMSGHELHKGQVVLTTEAPAGVVMQIPDNKKYILSQRVIAINLKEDIILEDFFAHLLRTEMVQQNIRRLSTGGTAVGISQKSLKGLFLCFPSSLEEQKRIGELFSSFDLKINLLNNKIKNLKHLKYGLLQQMFI